MTPESFKLDKTKVAIVVTQDTVTGELTVLKARDGRIEAVIPPEALATVGIENKAEERINPATEETVTAIKTDTAKLDATLTKIKDVEGIKRILETVSVDWPPEKWLTTHIKDSLGNSLLSDAGRLGIVDKTKICVPRLETKKLEVKFTHNPKTAPTAVKETGGTLTAGTYTYVYTAKNPFGETMASPSVSVTITDADVAAGDRQIKLSWTAIHGATAYRVYRGGLFLSEVTTLTFTDTGAITPALPSPPTISTATKADIFEVITAGGYMDCAIINTISPTPSADYPDLEFGIVIDTAENYISIGAMGETFKLNVIDYPLRLEQDQTVSPFEKIVKINTQPNPLYFTESLRLRLWHPTGVLEKLGTVQIHSIYRV